MPKFGMWNVECGILELPRRWDRTFRVCAVTGLALIGLVGGAKALYAGEAPPQTGIIVSIRGSIIEIQPAWLTGHQRLLVDPNTPVFQELELPIAKIPIGTRVAIFGEGDLKSGLTGYYVAAGNLDSEGISEKLVGVMKSQWGNYWGGAVMSVDPLVVRDDAGAEIKTTELRTKIAHLTRRASMSDVLIGRKISYESDKTAGGVHHVTSLSIESTPGKAGVVFATVVSRKGRALRVIPRFGSTPADVTVAANARVQRQITLDPDHVVVGDTLSAWGVPAQGRRPGLVAYALMRGDRTFPIASKDGPDRSISGRVRSLSPFTLGDSKSDTVLYITGQTPLVDIVPSNLDSLRRGDPVMLIVSKAAGGATTTDYVLVDASPILAFAFAN